MTSTLDVQGGPADEGKIPPWLASVMWPELPSVIEEVVDEIRNVLPDYARPEDSAYDQIIRLGVERILTGFVQQIEDPATPTLERNETCRALGHFEAVEGRTLDTLHNAYRIAFHVAWRHASVLAARENFEAPLMAAFGDAMITYLEEATQETMLGYRQARAQTDLQFNQARRQLLVQLLEQPDTTMDRLRELALEADWKVPETVTLVAVRPGAAQTRSALDLDVLCDLDGDRPCLMVPGPVDGPRKAMLTTVLGTETSVVGVSVPLRKAADSLRWARRVLRLAEEGVVEDGPLIDCERHLVTIWLMADPSLMDHLARKHLAPLAELSEHHRQRLTETLREWVTSRGNAVEVSEKLKVHPQTVRYRLRQLDAYIGDALSEPLTRFSVEMALRAVYLNNRRRTSLGRS